MQELLKAAEQAIEALQQDFDEKVLMATLLLKIRGFIAKVCELWFARWYFYCSILLRSNAWKVSEARHGVWLAFALVPADIKTAETEARAAFFRTRVVLRVLVGVCSSIVSTMSSGSGATLRSHV